MCVALRQSVVDLALALFGIILSGKAKKAKTKKKALSPQTDINHKTQKKKKHTQIFNTFNQSQLSCHYCGVAMGADMHAEQKSCQLPL